jgi:hypothetical protein
MAQEVDFYGQGMGRLFPKCKKCPNCDKDKM